MRGGLRHRRFNHAGNPVQATMTNSIDKTKVELALLHNQGISKLNQSHTGEDGNPVTEYLVHGWADQSVSGNNAAQTTAENKPVLNTDNSIEFFNYSDNATYADHMNLTNFTVDSSTPFMSFIVCSLGSTGTSCYLSDSGAEVLEFQSGNTHQLKTGTTSNMNHSSTFQISNGEKHLFVVERNSSHEMRLYKNGLLHDTETTNTGDFDLESLGVKNLDISASNWFDGAMYDVIFINNYQDNFIRKKIEDYLLKKNGLNRLGNG